MSASPSKLSHLILSRGVSALLVPLVAVLLAVGVGAIGAAPAAADTGTGIGITEITCTQVTFTYEGFANGENTVNESVTINHQPAGSTVFTFSGPTGTNTIPIAELSGHNVIDAHATWNTNGVKGGFDHHVGLRCPPGAGVQKLQKIDGGTGEYTASQLNGRIGQTVDYEIVVTNNGSVPLTFSKFMDANCDEGTIAGGSESSIEPGGSTTYTCTRLLTAIGTYSNEATVTATPGVGPSDTVTSNKVVVVVAIESDLKLEKLQKVAGSEAPFTTEPVSAGVGTKVEYEIIVTDNGNTPLKLSEFSDPKCDAGTIAGGPGEAQLLPGESTVYTCSHTIAVKDAKKGVPYQNTASVRGTPPPGDGNPVRRTSNTVIVEYLGGTGITEFGCTGVVFKFSGFPNAAGNTVTEVISIGHKPYSTTVFTFNGPTGTNTVALELPPGKYLIDAHATWNTNGSNGGFDHHANVRCT